MSLRRSGTSLALPWQHLDDDGSVGHCVRLHAYESLRFAAHLMIVPRGQGGAIQISLRGRERLWGGVRMQHLVLKYSRRQEGGFILQKNSISGVGLCVPSWA